jgi:hypothetical protein
MKLMLSGHHKVPTKPRLTLGSRLRGVPVASPSPGQSLASMPDTPVSTSQPSASHRSAIHHPKNSTKSPPGLQNQRPNLQKPLKTNGFRWFPQCQPGHQQHQFWTPKSIKLTPRCPQRSSKSSQAHPKSGLEAPKMTPNTSMCSRVAQSEPNLSPGTPKTHPKALKIRKKPNWKVNKATSWPQLSLPAPIVTHPTDPKPPSPPSPRKQRELLSTANLQPQL